MFQETSEGQTHYQNDGCGEAAHNDMKSECCDCFGGFKKSDNKIECICECHEKLVEEKCLCEGKGIFDNHSKKHCWTGDYKPGVKNNKKGWEEFDKNFVRMALGGSEKGNFMDAWFIKDGITVKSIKDFIRKLLKDKDDEFEKKLDDYRNNIGVAPMGVSQWRNHGEKYGYNKFFYLDIDDIWHMLIMSLPPDAENLSTLTPNQALKVVESFMDKLDDHK